MALQDALGLLSTPAANRASMDRWLSQLISDVDARPRQLRTSVRDLGELLAREADLHMLSQEMFREEPRGLLDRHALSSTSRVRDVGHLLALLDAAADRAPAFDADGLVGLLPFYSLLNWFLCTPAGARLFLDRRVNGAMKPILDDWAKFLCSPDSRGVLNDDDGGWFSRSALRKAPDFDADYVCDPEAPFHGYSSWDDFFTRRLRPGARPVAAPEDPGVIVNACESAPYRISTGVAATDTFWLKDHPYSLRHMLADESLAERFAGGTVYQGVLGPTNYHRWHSPIDGTIVSARVEPGVYFWIEPSASLTRAGALESQTYLSQLATRAIILIEADNKDIGPMCVVPVGLMECSTCEVTVRAGQRVAKGDELGMFHFGGSTHCLVFGPDVRPSFDLHGQTPGPEAGNIRVNAQIASVHRRG